MHSKRLKQIALYFTKYEHDRASTFLAIKKVYDFLGQPSYICVYIIAEFANFTAFGPPEPENGEVFNGRGPRYRKQSCHAGYTIACDNGLFKRIVVESGLRPTKNVFIICVEGEKRNGLLATGSAHATLKISMILNKKIFIVFC